MRKVFLAGFAAASALILAHQPAAAANVTDYTNFTNNTSEQWVQTSYTQGSGETMGYLSAASIAARGISDTYYYALAQTPSSAQIVWKASDNTTCTFISSTQLNHYGNWERLTSGTATGPRSKEPGAVHCNAPNPGSDASSGYTFTYSVSS